MSEALQWGPEPAELVELVKRIKYRPGWQLRVWNGTRDQDYERDEALAGGWTLDVITRGFNTYHPEDGDNYHVHHYFPVPAATYNVESWTWWVFQCLLKVEQHEAMEFFTVDGERVYRPNHGPGWDPYLVTVLGSDADRRTSFRGELKE